jgi:predicted N-formylglutamate amidohydrolase
MPKRQTSILITCEHGGNRIPPRYRQLFRGHEDLLQTHRGWDPGALVMAKQLAKALHAPLFVSTVSRLLIDLNRSKGHPRLYSEATRAAPPEVRREIFEQYYLPYREQVESHIAREIARGRRVVHISSHSFTPVLAGEGRNADIGLLYDPSRKGELELCVRWQKALQEAMPGLRVRRNYPYTGKSDGFTAYLRRRFAAAEYVGVELEVNQGWVARGGRQWFALRQGLVRALAKGFAIEHRCRFRP